MDYHTTVKRLKNNEITLLSDIDIDIPKYFLNKETGNFEGVFTPYDPRCITVDQRKYIYALFGDMVEYTGEPIDYVKPYLKALFCLEMGWDDFSLAYNKMTQYDAGKFIEFIIEYFFKNQIPFKHEEFYVSSEHTRVLFIYLKYRRCFISGEKGEVAHYEAVGMGNNRRKIDHSKHRFMCLSHKYHMEQHQIGITKFCKLYHIKPIKLTPEQVEEFGIGKNLHKEVE